jgi:hypothetical protein
MTAMITIQELKSAQVELLRFALGRIYKDRSSSF